MWEKWFLNTFWCVCVCVFVQCCLKVCEPFRILYICINITQNIIRFFAQVLKVNPIKQTRQKHFLYHLFIHWKMIQYCISVSGISMWISWISCSFKGEVRVHLCRGVLSQCNDYQMSVRDRFYSKNRDLSKSDHVCGSESCQKQRRLWRTSGKELMLLIRLEKVTKLSLKSLYSTNPQSDRLCTTGGNSWPLLPSREVVDQQRSLQSRTCNSLWGW